VFVSNSHVWARRDQVVLLLLLPLCRIGLCFAAIFVLWDMKAVFYAIWQPFDWLVGYTDPRKGAQDRLHGKHTQILLGSKFRLAHWTRTQGSVNGLARLALCECAVSPDLQVPHALMCCSGSQQ
jgi:hypothetical protein